MKKRIVLTAACLVAALSLLWTGFAMAGDLRTGQAPHVMSDEVIDGALYAAGGDIKIEGHVKGDVFCAGQTVEISGTVEGDVICAGQNVTIGGHVEGDIRVAGQVVGIEGAIDGSATVAGQSVTVQTAATVGRDINVFAQQATVNGGVSRDAQVVADSFTGDATVGRDLSAIATTVTLHDKTAVGGNFTYRSEPEASVATGAHIAGKTEHKIPEPNTRATVTPARYMTSAIFGLTASLLVGIVLLVCAPRLVAATLHSVRQSPLATIAVGCAGLIVLPVVGLVAMITVIGIPLGLLIFLGWIASMLIAVPISAHTLGSAIIAKLGWRDAWQHFGALAIGLFVIFLATLLPVIGGLFAFSAAVWGAGILWYTIIKRRGPGLGAAGEVHKKA